MYWSDFKLGGEDDLLKDDFESWCDEIKENLTVLGWHPEHKRQRSRVYFIICSVCSKDKELFGDGVFISRKAELVRGSVPCGCSPITKWTEEQYRIRVVRLCKELGYQFNGWAEEFKGYNTRLKLVSRLGETDSLSISRFLKGQRCRLEKAYKISQAFKKKDEVIIQKFMDSGQFHPLTEFWRSDTISNDGYRRSWWVKCGECGEVAESKRSNLYYGFKPCSCSNGETRFSYISVVYDGEEPIALKFGVSSRPSQRNRNQNRTSSLKIDLVEVWEFESKYMASCAENSCMSRLNCGIVERFLMPDGWTETTYLYNFDTIKEIFSEFSGVKI